MEEPVIAFDLARMFLGDDPPLFFAEIVVRTLIIYGYALALIRWVGGRGVAQLSLVEFLLVIALGSAVGDAAFYPEVPLLHAMLVVSGVVAINKGLDLLIQRHDAAKDLIDGVPVALVRDGRLLPEGMKARAIGAAEVVAALRLKEIRNLGEVEQAFMEADGAVSVFRTTAPRPGLSIMPPAEIAPPAPLRDPAAAPAGQACCAHCGGLAAAQAVLPDRACPHCGEALWVRPVSP